VVPVPGDRLLISRDGNLILPPADYPEEFGPDILFGREIGVPDGRSRWAAEVAPGVEPPEGSVFRDLRGLFFGMDEDVFRTTGRAKQIVGWNATHRFCGRCGGQTEPVPGELAKKCMRCGMLHYPPTTLA
jgi:NAD+ diphosphatase